MLKDYVSLVGAKEAFKVEAPLFLQLHGLCQPGREYKVTLKLWAADWVGVKISLLQEDGLLLSQWNTEVQNYQDSNGVSVFRDYDLFIGAESGIQQIVVEPVPPPNIAIWLALHLPKDLGALADKRREKGLCPQCGEMGRWISLALTCTEHGPYG